MPLTYEACLDVCESEAIRGVFSSAQSLEKCLKQWSYTSMEQSTLHPCEDTWLRRWYPRQRQSQQRSVYVSVRVAYGHCCFQSGRKSKAAGGRKPYKMKPERLGIYQDDEGREALQGCR